MLLLGIQATPIELREGGILNDEAQTATWKKLLMMAWPLIVANSFWTLQMTIDRVFLGAYSTAALGAAMGVMGVFWTPMALLQQTSGYVATFVAQYSGAQKPAMIGASVWQAFYVSVVGGLLFYLLTLVSFEGFSAIGHAPDVVELEVEYFDAIAHSALPTALVAAISGYYTGLGQTRLVMFINAVGLLVNALFDYLLIFGNLGFPAWGIAGAGYATALAAWGSALFGFGLLLWFRSPGKREHALAKGWRWNGELMGRFMKFGVPSGLQWALEGLAFTVFLIILGRFPNGTVALAASSIAVTIMMLSILPTIGLAQAVMVSVGQHLGEGRPQLAEKVTWSGARVAFVYMLILGSSFLIVPEFYLSWFENKSDQELWQQVSQVVPLLLAFVAVFTLFDSFNFNFSFALKGAGDTRFVSAVALILPWPLMVLPTFLMKDWDNAISWAWGAATVYAFVQAAVFWARFRGGKWKSMTVMGEGEAAGSPQKTTG